MTKPKPKPKLEVIDFKPDIADPDVVEHLQSLLDRAKSGEIRAMSYAAWGVRPDSGADFTIMSIVGRGQRIHMIAHAELVVFQMKRDFCEEGDE